MTELKTNRTQEEWAALDPYLGQSQRWSGVLVVSKMKQDILTLFADKDRLQMEIRRLRALLSKG